MGDPVFFFARTYVGVFVRMLSLLVSFPSSILGIFQMNIYKGADSKTSASLTLGDIVFAVVYGDPSHHFVQKKTLSSFLENLTYAHFSCALQRR